MILAPFHTHIYEGYKAVEDKRGGRGRGGVQNNGNKQSNQIYMWTVGD
jgi:hypothetical protein